MALSNAANLANLASSDALTVDNTNDRVGIASTTPTVTLDVAGIVSATAFYGDGSNLEGVASAGLGTALSDSGDLSVLYYTDERLSIGDTITVTVPDSSNVAYTQYQEIVLESGADLIVSDGDDLIPDILGIASDVQQPGTLAGAGGRVRADNYTSKAGGAPTFPSGVVVSGVSTFNSNVSIAGTLTYEDVTNVDSVGLITARSGVRVTGGSVGIGTDNPSQLLEVQSDSAHQLLLKRIGGAPSECGFKNSGNLLVITNNVNGIEFQTGTSLENTALHIEQSGNVGIRSENPDSALDVVGSTSLNGLMLESINITAGKLSDNTNIDLVNGMVHYFTTTETTTSTPNIRIDGSTTLNNSMSVGDTAVVTIITTAAAAGYATSINIDGSATGALKWVGGSVPTAGSSSGLDMYSFQIIKTASATYTVIANLTNAA